MKIDGLFIFLAGAGIGSFTTYLFVSKKFDKLANDEIAEVRAMYETRMSEPCTDGDSIFSKGVEEMKETQEALAKKAINKKDITDYNKIISKEKYENKEQEEEKVNIDDEIELYPEDFGEDNDVIYATYYSDGYLIDDDDHMVDIDMIGGRKSLVEIGEGSDILQIRNNTYELDYEIVFDERAYADVSGKEDLPDISEEEE